MRLSIILSPPRLLVAFPELDGKLAGLGKALQDIGRNFRVHADLNDSIAIGIFDGPAHRLAPVAVEADIDPTFGLAAMRQFDLQILMNRWPAAFDFITTWPMERSLNFRSTIMTHIGTPSVFWMYLSVRQWPLSNSTVLLPLSSILSPAEAAVASSANPPIAADRCLPMMMLSDDDLAVLIKVRADGFAVFR
jgi:hypothetical protein